MLGDSLLDAAIKTYQPVDDYATDKTNAQKIQSNESLLAKQQQELQLGQMKLDEAAAETPLNTALVKQQQKTSLLYNAIAKATDAQSFDTNMRSISEDVPEAQQYIGRYTPVLQSRLLGVYGKPERPIGVSGAGLEQPGAAPTKGAATGAGSDSGLDYQFAQTTPEQRANSLKMLSTFSTALEQVGDEHTWDAMRQKLDAAGIPLMDQLGDYSPIKAASLYQRVQPIVNYLQNRAVADESGIPSPKAAPDIKVVGNSIFSLDPYAGTAKQIGAAPKFVPGGADMMGNPSVLDENTGKRSAGQGDGVFGFDDFAKRMTGQENATGDRTAKNPNSSATGDGQFTDATWLSTLKGARPELAENMTDKQLLQLRKDPAISQEMTAQYAQSNAAILDQNGQHVNATSLALAHRFGPAGALAVLNAAPDAPLSSVLSHDAIKANPGLEKETAGGYVKDLSQKVGLDTIGTASNAGSPQSEVMDKIAGAKRRDEALGYVPQQIRGTVTSMLSGRMAPPSGMALKTPYWQNLMNMANAIDPNFDQVTWTARLNANKDMQSGGKSKTLLNSGETAINHLARLNDQIKTVSGVALPLVGDYINKGVNKVEQPYTGGLNTYNDTLGHLAEETTKFYRGSGGAEADVSRNMDNLSPDLSTEAKRKGVENTVDLIYGKLMPMIDGYNKTMGTDFPPSHFITKKTTQNLKSLGFDPDTGEKTGAAESGAATAPAGVIRYDKQGKRI